MRSAQKWIPPLIWLTVIFTLSSIPSKEIPDITVIGLDKAVHLGEFLIFGILLARAFNRRAIIMAIFIALVCAFLDEWHQSFIPGRTPDLFDFAFDIIGATIGAAAKKRWSRDGDN